jgi:beta-galactosidase
MKAELANINGVMKIRINGELFEPIAFRSYWPGPETIKNFAQRGMRLITVFPTGILCSLQIPYSKFGEVWLGEGKYNWQALRNQMDYFIEKAPDAYFALVLQLDTRDWFQAEHPEGGNSYFQLGRIAGWEVWRRSAAKYIEDMIDYLEKEYPEKIFGVYVCAGSTTEWLTDREAVEQTPLKQLCYAQWKGDPAARIPSDDVLDHKSHGLFRDPVIDKDALDFWRFHNEIIADAVCFFSRVVKEHTQGRLLVGCYFGYIIGPTDRVARGHLAMHKVYISPDVDMISAPAGYQPRGLESTSGELLPVESVTFRNKLYFHEIDNTAFPANGNIYAQVLQVNFHRRHKSLYESIQYSRREAALALSRRGAYWWFDMFGGWYDDDTLMDELAAIDRAAERIYSKPVQSIAEIAVLIDAESNYYLAQTGVVKDALVSSQRETLGKIGAPVDFYTAKDFMESNFPLNQYKLLIFPDLFAPATEMREKIAVLRNEGKCMLFQYAAGAITPQGFSAASISELTGITIEETDHKASYTVVHPGKCSDEITPRIYGHLAAQADPVFACMDPKAEIYGADMITSDGHLALKERKQGGFDVWSLFGPLPSFVLRSIARLAGVHIYEADDLPVYINSRMVALFDHEGGGHLLVTPWTKGKLVELYTGEEHRLDGQPVQLDFQRDECKCFLYEEI